MHAVNKGENNFATSFMGGSRVEPLSEMETKQRMLSANETPDFVNEWQVIQYQEFARESLYVE